MSGESRPTSNKFPPQFGRPNDESVRRIVNLIGALGYTLLAFSCAVALGAAILWATQNGIIYEDQQQEIAQTTEPASTAEPGVIVRLMQYLFATIVFSIIVFVSITLPYWLGRLGSKILKRAIRFCGFAVTLRNLLLAKILLCGTVLAMVVLGGMLGVCEVLVVLVSGLMTSVSLVNFLVQHYLAGTTTTLEAKEVW